MKNLILFNFNVDFLNRIAVMYHYNWEKNLQKLKRFKQIYQHTEVPIIWGTDQVLATWVNKVRSLKVMLTDKLLKELAELDFNFNSGLNYEWDLMYEKLVSFNRKFGHWDIPNGNSKYKALLIWIENQRKVEKYLNSRKLELLNEVKFPWLSIKKERPRDLLWNKKFEELVEFKKSYGHCNVPAHSKKYHSLSIWVFKHRQKEEKGKLRKHRKDKLDSIGFAWRKDLRNQEEDIWNERFEELRRFKAKYGHTKFPKKNIEYPHLFSWIHYQKFLKNNSLLSTEKIEKLNSLDFIWVNIPGINWEKMFKQLLDYKAKYGHAIISTNHKKRTTLCVWASTQRKYWKEGNLNIEKIKKLENIGFKCSNDTKSSKWLTMFNSLVDFKHVHGHVHVAADVNEYTLLYLWSMKQKDAYREGSLDNEKVLLLKSIAFKFNS